MHLLCEYLSVCVIQGPRCAVWLGMVRPHLTASWHLQLGRLVQLLSLSLLVYATFCASLTYLHSPSLPLSLPPSDSLRVLPEFGQAGDADMSDYIII